MFNKTLIILFSIILNTSSFIYAQCDKSDIIVKINGEIIRNKKYFKHFAVLLQDTCNIYNTFTNDYIHNTSTNDLYNTFTNNYRYKTSTWDTTRLPSVIVNSKLFLLTEACISNDKNLRLLKKYIRIYIGCVDNNGDTCLIVKFIKKTYFRRNNKENLKELNLFQEYPYVLTIFKFKNDDVYLLHHSDIKPLYRRRFDIRIFNMGWW